MQDQSLSSTPGQARALWMSTIAFTVCFAVWTIFAIIGVQIKEDLGLNETEFGLLVGTPILTGSLTRIFLGIWTDQYGGRRVYTVVMLAAALATFMLTYAHTYPQILLAALGVGVAGGSFAVGIAYVSRWYPPEKQGTALGIFGAGNVGAAVTKFFAPFVLVAYGWHVTAQVWAAAIAIMAVIFWFTTKEDPAELARRAKGERPRSALLELEPLKNLQVWRFSLYYFFAFGAFVALALWLPRYLIGVYKVDIETAGMLAVAYTLPASLFRAYGGHLSDRYGARRVMYWMFGVSALVTFILAYPPTEYIVQGMKGPIQFHHGDRRRHLHLHDLRARLLHEPGQGRGLQAHPGLLSRQRRLRRRPGRHDRRPRRLRAADRLRRAQRPHRRLDELLHAAVPDRRRLAGLDASRHPAHGARGAWRPGSEKLPQFPEMQPIHEEKHEGALAGHVLTEWKPEDQAFWDEKGKAIARRNLWISIPALLLAFAVWMVWSVVVAKLPAVGFKFTTDQLFWLAAMPGLSGATLRIFYSFMPPIFGGRLWTTVSTWSLMVPAVGIGLAVQNTDTPYIIFLSLALLCGLGGGNFASSMANISFFYPKAEKGNALALNAGLGNTGVSVVQFVIPLVITTGVFGWLGGDPQAATGATKLWLQNAGFIWVPFIAISATAAWFGMNDIAAMKASFADQAVIFKRKHNWMMCWLYTGTFGSFIGYSAGFPLLGQDPVPGRRLAEVRLPRAAGRRLVALGHRLAVGSLRRRPRHLLDLRGDDRGGRRRALLPRHQGASRARSGASSRCSWCCSSRPAWATRPPSR